MTNVIKNLIFNENSVDLAGRGPTYLKSHLDKEAGNKDKPLRIRYKNENLENETRFIHRRRRA